MGLNETGILDPKTLEVMNSPRCSNKDQVHRHHHSPAFQKLYLSSPGSKFSQEYSLYGTKWDKDVVTYSITRYSYQRVSPEFIDAQIRAAFREWERHIPLKFIPTDEITEVSRDDAGTPHFSLICCSTSLPCCLYLRLTLKFNSPTENMEIISHFHQELPNSRMLFILLDPDSLVTFISMMKSTGHRRICFTIQPFMRLVTKLCFRRFIFLILTWNHTNVDSQISMSVTSVIEGHNISTFGEYSGRQADIQLLSLLEFSKFSFFEKLQWLIFHMPFPIRIFYFFIWMKLWTCYKNCKM